MHSLEVRGGAALFLWWRLPVDPGPGAAPTERLLNFKIIPYTQTVNPWLAESLTAKSETPMIVTHRTAQRAKVLYRLP